MRVRDTRPADAPVTFGVVVYDGVEPIDIGGTVGVVSMARRVLPGISCFTVGARRGPIRLEGGLTMLSDHGFEDCPPCDRYIVCGGPGWRDQVTNDAMLRFLASRHPNEVASVCTGALILAAAGILDGRLATTRRAAVGTETVSPLDTLSAQAHGIETAIAAVVDDRGLVTGGGVSLAIDCTLYLIGDIFGVTLRDEVARIIEYDRAFSANLAALGHVRRS